MRIACPECNAAYDLPPAQLVPGRPARCARCGTVWTPVATEDAQPPIPAAVIEPRTPPAPEPEPEPEPPPLVPDFAVPPDPDLGQIVPPLPEAGFHAHEHPEPFTPPPEPATAVAMPEPRGPAPRRRGPILAGWIVTAIVLVAVAVLAVARRDAVVAAWPPAERAYRAFGLSH